MRLRFAGLIGVYMGSLGQTQCSFGFASVHSVAPIGCPGWLRFILAFICAAVFTWVRIMVSVIVRVRVVSFQRAGIIRVRVCLLRRAYWSSVSFPFALVQSVAHRGLRVLSRSRACNLETFSGRRKYTGSLGLPERVLVYSG